MPMQRIDELHHDGLVALTDEQVERFIDIEIANRGIMPVEQPVPPSLETVGIVKDDKAFEVAGIIVRTREEAEAILKMDVLREEHNYQTGYEYRWLVPNTDKEIAEVGFYRQEEVVRLQDALCDIERKNDDYSSRKRQYDKFLEETGSIRNSVWGIVNEARELQAEIDLAQKTYQHHLDLAEGDPKIAGKFFRHAYEGREDLIKAVLGDVMDESPEPVSQSTG